MRSSDKAEKIVIKDAPGTIVGMSTHKPLPGSVVFYDGDTPFGEVELKEAWPPVKTGIGETLPGVVIDQFCENSIKVQYHESIHPDDIEFVFN